VKLFSEERGNARVAVLVVIALLAGLGSGYWLARFKPVSGPSAPPAPAVKKPLFYRHPMNPSVTSPVPAKDEMGMDYVPVYAEEAPKARQPAFYRHPMNPSVTSPVPAKDEMGMDYVPVYPDDITGKEPETPGLATLTPEKVQKLGVRTAAAEIRPLSRTVRATGIVEADERRLHDVVIKFDGYIEKLHVNATGQPVKAGQILFELYSPELLAAQEEYLIARRGRPQMAEGGDSARQTLDALAQGGLERLRNFGIADAELRRLERENTASRTLPVRSPASGIVMEKRAVAGMKAPAGELLFRIADLSTVWVQAEIFEQDLSLVDVGRKAQITLDAYPGRVFEGRVNFVYPVLNQATRTARVRLELPNPDGVLKPMMYAHAVLSAPDREVLAVPASALLNSGQRTVVLVERGEGRYEPRPVEIGQHGDEIVEIRSGLRAGERVVVSANFLIDAESNLRAVLDSFGAPPQSPAGPPPSHPEHRGH
jgi:Cu(I)/Ag(I) efflux system membrane fusion protein